mgnify:CR=1 FL=1
MGIGSVNSLVKLDLFFANSLVIDVLLRMRLSLHLGSERSPGIISFALRLHESLKTGVWFLI